MRVDYLSGAAMVLTAAAVLVWPASRSQLLMPLPRSAAPGRAGGAPAGEDPMDTSPNPELGTRPDPELGTSDPELGTSSDPESAVARVEVPVAEIAAVIDLLALSLRGGVGLVEAMEAVATRVGGPLGLHLQTVAAARRWGVEDATAWASVPAAWQPAARALRMAASAGVPPADALVGAADEVRRREQNRLEVATATLGVRIVLPLGLVFLPAFILTTVMPIVLALAQQLLASQ